MRLSNAFTITPTFTITVGFAITVAFAIAVASFLLIVALMAGSPLYLYTLIIAGILAVTGLLVWLRQGQISVNELEVAIVFDRQRNRFSRFLPSGTHWINPFREEITARLSTAGQSVKGISKGGQTSGGIAVSVDWQVSYSLKPERINPADAPKLARSLPLKSGAIVTKHINHIIHLVLDRYKIADLIQSGAQTRLEREIRLQLRARLDKLGIDVSRVMLDGIHLPHKVRESLAAAHEREMRIESEARGLERLHSVINRFSDADMARLIEIERIQLLGQNGVTMLYPAEAQLGNLGSYKRG